MDARNESDATTTQEIEFYLSQTDTCPYREGLSEQKVLTRLQAPFAASLYDQLIQNGFRRSRDWAYRPRCPACSACTPIRVPVRLFTPGSSWRRVLKQNADLTATSGPARFREHHWRLFQAYLESRHGDGEMAGMQREDYRAMVSDSPVHTVLFDWQEPQGTSLAACIVDRVSGGLSAVYSFFEPSLAKRSLGSYVILDLIEICRREGLDFLYLGYWIDGAPKMDYKARFRPLEAFGPGGWKTL